MNHIKKLQDYLIGNDNKTGYLLQDISKGKVIMLSGQWGSGKTHFWQEKILKTKNIKNNNIYISLYGKKSIEDIENEVLIKAYYRSIGRENEEQDKVEKAFSVFSSTSKIIDTFLGTKINDVIDEVLDKNEKQKNKKAEKFIDDGLMICFDDFERKSSYVNLQDLFGFITNLSLQYQARIIIILNSDVFKGKEKEIFTNVKEKSVSKYLSFVPDCKDLFDLIFEIEDEEKKKKYLSTLNEHKIVLQESFEEVNIANARIMMQTLDNLIEWINDNVNSKDDDTLRLFILVNINFILNHLVYEAVIKTRDVNAIKNFNLTGNQNHAPKNENYTDCKVKQNKYILENLDNDIIKHTNNNTYNENIIETLKIFVEREGKENATKSGKADNSKSLLDHIDNNTNYFKSLHFMYCFRINEYCQKDENKVIVFNKINNFIETGTL